MAHAPHYWTNEKNFGSYSLLYYEVMGSYNEPLGAEAPPLVGGGGARRRGGVAILWVHNITFIQHLHCISMDI